MSLTGNFVDADTAYQWGLVNQVVPHTALMERARGLAAVIAEIDPDAIGEIRAMYDSLGPGPPTTPPTSTRRGGPVGG